MIRSWPSQGLWRDAGRGALGCAIVMVIKLWPKGPPLVLAGMASEASQGKISVGFVNANFADITENLGLLDL